MKHVYAIQRAGFFQKINPIVYGRTMHPNGPKGFMGEYVARADKKVVSASRRIRTTILEMCAGLRQPIRTGPGSAMGDSVVRMARMRPCSRTSIAWQWGLPPKTKYGPIKPGVVFGTPNYYVQTAFCAEFEGGDVVLAHQKCKRFRNQRNGFPASSSFYASGSVRIRAKVVLDRDCQAGSSRKSRDFKLDGANSIKKFPRERAVE